MKKQVLGAGTGDWGNEGLPAAGAQHHSVEQREGPAFCHDPRASSGCQRGTKLSQSLSLSRPAAGRIPWSDLRSAKNPAWPRQNPFPTHTTYRAHLPATAETEGEVT